MQKGNFISKRSLGFRPLVYGKKDGLFCAASESAALSNLNIDEFKSLEPGYILR